MILLIKSIYTLFVATIVGLYWKSYGPQNFLWMSDIGLFLTLGALWLESPLLISICICAFLAVELIWNIDFFILLTTGKKTMGLTDYMFDPQYALFLRLLSLFHVVLPVIWILLAIHWRYEACALWYAVPMVWIILIVTHVVTNPAENINWVFMPAAQQWKGISNTAWFMIMLIGYPLLICLPTHMVFKRMVEHVEKPSCM
jgi:hypothetical protein